MPLYKEILSPIQRALRYTHRASDEIWEMRRQKAKQNRTNKMCLWNTMPLAALKSNKYFNGKVTIKVTMLLALVSFERASLVKYACQISNGSKVIAKVQIDRRDITTCSRSIDAGQKTNLRPNRITRQTLKMFGRFWGDSNHYYDGREFSLEGNNQPSRQKLTSQTRRG